MKIVLDGERCTGHGRCYAVGAPFYESDDDGYCSPPPEHVPHDLEDGRLVQQLPETLPGQRLIVEEEQHLTTQHVAADATVGSRSDAVSRCGPGITSISSRGSTLSIPSSPGCG